MKKESYSMLETGLASLGGGILATSITGINPLNLIILGSGVGMIGYDIYEKSTPHKVLFESLGIENKLGHKPLFKKKRKTKYGYQLLFTMPIGLSSDDFNLHSKRIEQYLNKPIKITYANKKLIINVYENKLEKTYDFEQTKTKDVLELTVGYSIGNKLETIDISKAPHLLICGETGSGKSTVVRCMLSNLILTKNPKKVQLHLIDLKNGSEFGVFRKCTKFVKSFARNIEDADTLLRNVDKEVGRRYGLFYENDCIDMKEYNEKFKSKKLDHQLVVIDEFADLQEEKATLKLVSRLAQKARACGIHLIISTQRPSAKIINGEIKANIPSVLGLKTMNALNSRIVIDEDGLENLRGAGHGILKHEGKKVELQSMFLPPEQARDLLKEQHVEEKEELNTSNFIKTNSNAHNKLVRKIKDDTLSNTPDNTKKDKQGEIKDFDFLNNLGGF